MLAKQIMVISILIPFIEYYNFIAVKKAVQKRSQRYRKRTLVAYILLSVCVLAGLFAFPRLATTAWPSVYVKILVSILIAAFFGKFLVSILMFSGDILLILRRIGLMLNDRIMPKKSREHAQKQHEQKQGLITRSEFISKGALLCGAALTIGLSYGMTNKYRYKLRYVPLSLPGLPEEFKGFRIVQISDIHAGSFDNIDAVLNGVKMVLGASPHIVLFTGDLVNYRATEIVPYMDIFSKLTAPLGVYSVLGNHDYSDYISWASDKDKEADFEQLLGYEKELGWQLLRNSNQIIQWKGRRFALIGSENWSIKSRFPKHGNLEKAMSGLENTDTAFRILMSHDPSHWDAQVRPKYPDIHLTLSGHTHGMQLGVEIGKVKWSPSQYLYKQWAGLYKEENQYLYVNRGFGFIGYNGRLGIMPEITLFELT
jgi:hypothetical protein